MNGPKLVYDYGAEKPDVKLWWEDDAGNLVDFSSGYTWSFKIGAVGSTALMTKTSGITGATGAGSAPDGTPNVTIGFSSGELAITPGTYTYKLTPTSGGLDRDSMTGQFVVRGVIS